MVYYTVPQNGWIHLITVNSINFLSNLRVKNRNFHALFTFYGHDSWMIMTGKTFMTHEWYWMIMNKVNENER